MRKFFNYLAQDPKHQYTLGSLLSSHDGATPPLYVPLNRASRLVERGITLTGIFFAVTAFAATPVLAAVPALVGMVTLSKAAGFTTGFFAGIGARRAAGL